MKKYSDFIVFVDESGDHGVSNIDPGFPIFALAFVLVRKSEYSHSIVPHFMDLKFKYFGHENIILHEREIRKKEFPFFFRETEIQQGFLEDLSSLMIQEPFSPMIIVIEKNVLISEVKKMVKPYYGVPNLYHLSMRSALSVIWHRMQNQNEEQKANAIVPFVFEQRGKREDQELELEFRRLCDKEGYPFEIQFASKKANLIGLQLADLIARPIACEVLHPHTGNKAVEVIRSKLQGNLTRVFGVHLFA